MFTVFGYSVTVERFLLIWYLVAVAGGIWFLQGIVMRLARRIQQIDGRKLAANVSAIASGGASQTEALTSNYRPAVEAGLAKALGLMGPCFSFQGAASRKQFLLTQVASGFLLGIILGIGGSMYESWSNLLQLLGIFLIVGAICGECWIIGAVSAKRTRDTGITVWWVLTLLVPPLNFAMLVFLLLVPTNEFQGRGL